MQPIHRYPGRGLHTVPSPPVSADAEVGSCFGEGVEVEVVDAVGFRNGNSVDKSFKCVRCGVIVGFGDSVG